jgi:hypothetical protein
MFNPQLPKSLPKPKPIEERYSESFDVEVGPIYSKAHAQRIAENFLAKNPDHIWTGHWMTTQPGRMSVINVKKREN